MNDTLLKSEFGNAMYDLGIVKGHERGMYAPLAKRCPIRVDDEVPIRIKQLLEQNHTCACTDSDIVYVDTELAGDMFQKAKEAAGHEDLADNPWRVRDNFKTLLVHEYTHILMQHVDKGIKFVRANGDKNYPIFALACDIEANRGWGVQTDSDLYQIGVTEKSYPECVGVEGLMNIYRVLKKNYGDEINESYEKMRESMNGENGEDADDAEEGEGTKPADGGEEASEEEKDATERANALKRAIRSMEQMREEIEQRASTMTEEELDKDIEKYDEAAVGLGGDDEAEGAEAPTPYEELKVQYNKHLQGEVEKALDKLKGLVRGSQEKTRVKTYSRQSRREGADGLIRKGQKNKRAIAPRILVAMDSSGSMHRAEVTPVATAIGTIAKMLGKTKGSYICEHDSHVKNVNPLSKWEEVVKLYYPDGDNDFDEVLEKAIELNVELVINVGDGFARLYDMEIMKQAKEKGIRWFDVQVCGEKATLDSLIRDDEWRHGKNFIGREVIKVNRDE